MRKKATLFARTARAKKRNRYPRRFSPSRPRRAEARPSLFLHGNLQPGLAREAIGLLVPGVNVAGHADARVIGQDAVDAPRHFRRAIGHRDLAGVERIP